MGSYHGRATFEVWVVFVGKGAAVDYDGSRQLTSTIVVSKVSLGGALLRHGWKTSVIYQLSSDVKDQQ